MKLLIVAVAFAVLAFAASELCRETRDCHITGCAADGRLVCLLPEHICTCIHRNGETCTGSPDTCTGDCQRGWRCIDGHCGCRF